MLLGLTAAAEVGGGSFVRHNLQVITGNRPCPALCLSFRGCYTPPPLTQSRMLQHWGTAGSAAGRCWVQGLPGARLWSVIGPNCLLTRATKAAPHLERRGTTCSPCWHRFQPPSGQWAMADAPEHPVPEIRRDVFGPRLRARRGDVARSTMLGGYKSHRTRPSQHQSLPTLHTTAPLLLRSLPSTRSPPPAQRSPQTPRRFLISAPRVLSVTCTR